MSGTLEHTISSKHFTSLADAIDALKNEGYTKDFNLKQNRLQYWDCLPEGSLSAEVTLEQFEVDETFRFDNESDPADQSVLYAISCEDLGIRGLLVNGYGIYSDPVANAMLKKLSKNTQIQKGNDPEKAVPPETRWIERHH